MSAADVRHEAHKAHEEILEDFASEGIASVTQLAPTSDMALPPAPHGICVNCGSDVTLRVVATDSARRTYQWVPSDEPARRGRRCYEAAMPAFHWAYGASAAVYHVST